MSDLFDGIPDPEWFDTGDFPPNPGLIPPSEEGQAYLFMGLTPLDPEGFYQVGVWGREDAPLIEDYLPGALDKDALINQMKELEHEVLQTMLYFTEFKRLDVRGVRRTAYATAGQAVKALEESGLQNGSIDARITIINGFYYLWVDPVADRKFQKRKRKASRKSHGKAA